MWIAAANRPQNPESKSGAYAIGAATRFRQQGMKKASSEMRGFDVTDSDDTF